ncbi:MAG: hypothetical protein JOZ96_18085 [Acidobacteria bacterium]|nr:hypothetical protein [Acidobacteriota bacterium]
MRTLEKAERELAAGNLWRAKEILQGTLPQAGYHVELFEMLGAVLLRMGDLPEAGKFLFLSGVRRPEYEQAVGTFLRKYGKTGPYDFYRLLPRGARLAALSEYPVEVAQELRRRGLPESLRDAGGRVLTQPETGGGVIAWGSCLILAAAIGALIILGIIKLKEIVPWLHRT